MKKYIIIIPVFLLLLAACTNEIPFDVKDSESKMIINTLINTDCSDNRIFVSLTGKEDIASIDNVSVNLYVNGILKEKPEAIPDTDSSSKVKGFLIKNTTFKPGDKVKVEASTSDGKYYAWGEETVPERVDIIKIDTTTVRMKDVYSDSYSSYLRFKITFKDIPDKANFYRVVLEKKTTRVLTNQYIGHDETEVTYGYSFISREDVALTDGRPGTADDEENGISTSVSNTYGVFNDSRFRNGEYTLNISQSKSSYYYGDDLKEEQISVTVYLQSISETEYYYLQALNKTIDIVDDDILSESVHLPTNINGGIGLLGICSESSKTLQTYSWKAK
jgi:hypothetical protein